MLKRMKILAIVVTYFPPKNLLELNINAFISSVDRILIWENTPQTEKLRYRFIDHEKIIYCGDGINSISHALNFAWKYAKDNGYDFLLIMDQDSQWQDFDAYLGQTVYDPTAPEGIWGPAIAGNIEKKGVEEVYSVINSGTLVKVSLINRIGGWNEKFVIDGVDDEFCLHAKRLGINTYRFNECILNQRYGTPMLVSFLGKKGELRNDTPQRLYHIYKNFVLLMRMYPEAESFKKEFYRCWIKRIKWIVLFEDKRFSKLNAIIRGIVMGLTSKISE